MTPFRLAVMTATRAEYGHMRGIIRRAHEDPAVRLQLVVAGMHLDPAFGRTASEIEADGIPVSARVPLPLSGDSELSVARATGAGTPRFAAAFARLRPHALLVLGDRYELLAAVPAAAALGIPVAHLHGGEATEGVMDELVRHAVTKMSHLHFTAAEPYRRRVIQMGEHPSRVLNVGAPGLEALRLLKKMTRAELEADLGFSLVGKFALVTYHPETPRAAAAETAAIFRALRSAGIRAVATYANADAGGRAVNAFLRAETRCRPGRSWLLLLWPAALPEPDAFAAPWSETLQRPAGARARAPTVNVGGWQAGRLRAPGDRLPARDRLVLRALRLAFSAAFVRPGAGHSPYGGERCRPACSKPSKPAARAPAPEKIFTNSLEKTRMNCIIIGAGGTPGWFWKISGDGGG